VAAREPASASIFSNAYLLMLGALILLAGSLAEVVGQERRMPS